MSANLVQKSDECKLFVMFLLVQEKKVLRLLNLNSCLCDFFLGWFFFPWVRKFFFLVRKKYFFS